MQPPYGGPPSNQYGAPPSNNWGPPPQQGGYGPPGVNPQVAKLENDTNTWLIVAAASWFFGLMWIGGPLAWYQGNQIIGSYQGLGMQPASNATTLRLVGMISTILSILFMVCACLFVVFIGGIAVLGRGR